jgi:hypothetical protein
MMSNKDSDAKPNSFRALSEWAFDMIPECFPQGARRRWTFNAGERPSSSGGTFAGQENVHAEDQGSLTTPI